FLSSLRSSLLTVSLYSSGAHPYLHSFPTRRSSDLLCEVQSYVYGAKVHAGKLALRLDHRDLSLKWAHEAAVLKKNFNERFWDEELSSFVLALDGYKKPCRVKSSNAGHCLFTGIADKDKAVRLADTLLDSDMFSGWGVRTLSSSSGRYNPMSYHNGSIWPHDNALIAYGLSKYGLQKHVLEIIDRKSVV